MNKLKVSVISGASRSGRNSVKVARYVESLLQLREEVGEVQFLDIHHYDFPNYLDGSERSESLKERVSEFSHHLWTSDALVLVSPEYNGGMAGSTKNALDYFRKEYEKRPIGLVSVSSGTMGGINAMQQMVAFAHYVGACLSPKRLLVSSVQDSFDDNGNVTSERLTRNGIAFVDDLLELSQALSTAGKVPVQP
jgi:azobenzene reductase